ncbi:unnamed protein product, partial [marine sediment metagenome]
DYDKAIEIYKYVLIRYSDNDIAVEYANAYLGDIYLTLRRLTCLTFNFIKRANMLKQRCRLTLVARLRERF